MLLLIPGPVSTSPEVRAAMAQDIAPWDLDSRPVYSAVRERLLKIAHGRPETHVTLALQGCGHFGMEAAVRTFIPPGGRILVPQIGAYADRLTRLANEAGRVVVPLHVNPNRPTPPEAVAAALAADPAISHVGLVYSETGTGVIHDPTAIGAVIRAAGRRLILDAVSAFGALPLDVSGHPELDAVVFTSNKCFEGLPGLAFTVARIESLRGRAGQAGSWSFDLADVFAHAERSAGSFRFTPPIQVLFAFHKALDLYDAEGGQPARLARYVENAATLHAGMLDIGLQPVLPRSIQGPIVMNIHAPGDPAWNLQAFVDCLKTRGYLISNFFNTPSPSFRVGCIGAITPGDMRGFTQAVDNTLTELGIRTRLPANAAA